MRRGLLPAALTALLTSALGGCASNEEYVPLRHPFRGATLHVDTGIPATQWRNDHDAHWLDPIAETPQAHWLTGTADLINLHPYLDAARAQNALPVIVVYHIPNRDCAGRNAGGAADAEAYSQFIKQTIAVLGDTRAAMILEPDAAAAECFDDVRASLLAAATRRLADAGQYVYLDAGHPRWRTPQEWPNGCAEPA